MSIQKPVTLGSYLWNFIYLW